MFVDIIKYKLEINQLFKQNKIETAYVFGSSLTDDFNNSSDIDFLIIFKSGLEPLEKGELWWTLHDDLRRLFKREIDILIEGSFKNPYFIEELQKTKQKIYG